MALADRQRIAAGTGANQVRAAYEDGRRDGIMLVCETLAEWDIDFDDGLFRDPADLERLFAAILDYEEQRTELEEWAGQQGWSGHLATAATARAREAARR